MLAQHGSELAAIVSGQIKVGNHQVRPYLFGSLDSLHGLLAVAKALHCKAVVLEHLGEQCQHGVRVFYQPDAAALPGEAADCGWSDDFQVPCFKLLLGQDLHRNFQPDPGAGPGLALDLYLALHTFNPLFDNGQAKADTALFAP